MKNYKLVKLLELNIIDENGNIIHQEKNIDNMLHEEGAEFLLLAAFTGGNDPNTVIPDQFYFGLDNRNPIDETDTLDTISSGGDEPTLNGYTRQSVSSVGQFVVTEVSNVNRVVSPIITFQATGGSWGPVRNLFLATSDDDSGYLLSSMTVTPFTLLDGQQTTMRFALSLRDHDESGWP